MRDRGAAVAGEVAPFGDEDAGALRVGGDDIDVSLNQRRQALDWIRGGGLRLSFVGLRLEGGGGSVDDRPQDVFFGRHVGIEAGALDIERPGDVADARRRVAVRVEQLARNLFDLAPSRPGLDHRTLPNDC